MAEGSLDRIAGRQEDNLQPAPDIHAQEGLNDSERYFREVFENAPVGIFQSTADRLLRVNPALAKMQGYGSPAEMLAEGRPPASYFANREKREEIIREAVKRTDFVQVEADYRRKDNSVFAAILRMRAVRDSSGMVRFFEGFVEDIAGLRNAEMEASAALGYSHVLIQYSPIGIITFRATGEVVSANPAVAEMIGGTLEEVSKQNFRHLESWKRSGLYAAAGKALQTGRLQEFEVQHLSTFGKAAWLHAQLIPFVYAGEPHLLGLFSDITERKRVEAELRESQEKLCQLAENIEGVFWIADRQTGQVLYVSPAYEHVWGCSCQSLYDRPTSFADAIHPGDRQRMMAALARQAHGEDYDEEYRIARPDGSVRWIHDRGFVVRDAKGEYYRRAGLALDITDKKQLEEKLRQAQKMEEIGQLAGGVAHDFNNIAAAILMQLGLLRQNPQLTTGMEESLKEVEGEAIRAANLTRQLLLFSRRQLAHIEKLDLDALVGNLLKMLRRLLGENIDVQFETSTVAAWVEADTAMIEQLVMNLCTNARDSMPKGGQITLATILTERGAKSVKSHPDARPGRFACLSVADTGCGMDAEVLKRIFEPFFTTKEVGKGTGLGLATAYGIVKQHQGWIDVESTVGKGSVFRVYLPAITKPRENAPAPIATVEGISPGSETILLVEDEPSLRRPVALCLRKLGYAVLEAQNSKEALKLWETHRERIDLLLTDMVMPGATSGLDLAEHLRKEKPALRIILSSGYSADLSEPRSLEATATFLAKPFRLPTLAKVVRQCLDNKS